MTTQAERNAAHTDLVNRILLDLSPHGYVARNDTPGLVFDRHGRAMKLGVPGAADITGCIAGRAIAVEVKTGKGDLATKQRRWRDAWIKAGGAWAKGRSVEQARADLAAQGVQFDGR